MNSNADAVPTETDASLLPDVDVSSTTRVVNGRRLHVVAGGDPDGPLVVLLHGFPEFWYGWRHQLEPLLEAGYRVVVPDQRGYNRSEKPAGVGAYRLRYLTRDVVDLIDSEDRESAHVVGHDWGGIVAWDLAIRYPEVVDRLAVVNAPHPTVFQRHLRSNPEQLGRSWYAFSFQLPWLPERLCRYGEYRVLERALRATAAPKTFSDAELAHYRRAWGKEGALTGMLDWYRASARYPSGVVRRWSRHLHEPQERDPDRDSDRHGNQLHAVDVPTLVVWGEADTALVSELAADSAALCDQSSLTMLPETSHWVPHESPEQLTDQLLTQLST